MVRRNGLFIPVAVACLLHTAVIFAQAPAPSVPPTAVWTNTTGSRGAYCATQNGLQTALQGVANGQNSAGFNVTIPASLASSASIQNLAQVCDFAVDPNRFEQARA